MVFAPPLNTDDLRRWRSCERRFWLARRQLQRGVAAPAPAPTPEAAEPAPATGLDVALRASFPHADTVAAPQSPAQWLQAVRHTLNCLDSDAEPPEGWAVLGACLTSEDRAQVRIDVGAVDGDALAVAVGRLVTQRIQQALQHRMQPARTDVLLPLVDQRGDLGAAEHQGRQVIARPHQVADPGLAVDRRLRELAMCVVAVINGAEYEYAQHAPLYIAAWPTLLAVPLALANLCITVLAVWWLRSA